MHHIPQGSKYFLLICLSLSIDSEAFFPPGTSPKGMDKIKEPLRIVEMSFLRVAMAIGEAMVQWSSALVW